MTTAVELKCACEPCVCVINPEKAIEKEGQYYCSQACANGHAEGSSGCGHTGCDCHG